MKKRIATVYVLLLATLSYSRAIGIAAGPYESGELSFGSTDTPDSIVFSNGITTRVVWYDVHPSIVPEDCIDGQRALCLVVPNSGSSRGGIDAVMQPGALYADIGHLYEGTGVDSALLAFGLSPDTLWGNASTFPGALLDSVPYFVPHPRFFGVPVYYRQAHCSATFSRCWRGVSPSRNLIVYATNGQNSLKLQLSSVQFGTYHYTAQGSECSLDTLAFVTIRWAADSAGNGRFLPSNIAAQRVMPVSSPREQGMRIQRAPGGVLVNFSAPVESATLFNARGVAVARAHGQTSILTAPASRVKAGLYFLRVKRRGEVETIRVPVR